MNLEEEQAERRANVMVCKRCGYDYCVCHLVGGVPTYSEGRLTFAEMKASGFYDRYPTLEARAAKAAGIV